MQIDSTNIIGLAGWVVALISLIVNTARLNRDTTDHDEDAAANLAKRLENIDVNTRQSREDITEMKAQLRETSQHQQAMDIHLATIDQQVAAHGKTLEAHGHRLDSLEKAHYSLHGERSVK